MASRQADALAFARDVAARVGGTLTRGGSGHHLILDADGKPAFVVPSTPDSSNWQTAAYAAAKRRFGIDFREPPRKEKKPMDSQTPEYVALRQGLDRQLETYSVKGLATLLFNASLSQEATMRFPTSEATRHALRKATSGQAITQRDYDRLIKALRKVEANQTPEPEAAPEPDPAPALPPTAPAPSKSKTGGYKTPLDVTSALANARSIDEVAKLTADHPGKAKGAGKGKFQINRPRMSPQQRWELILLNRALAKRYGMEVRKGMAWPFGSWKLIARMFLRMNPEYHPIQGSKRPEHSLAGVIEDAVKGRPIVSRNFDYLEATLNQWIGMDRPLDVIPTEELSFHVLPADSPLRVGNGIRHPDPEPAPPEPDPEPTAEQRADKLIEEEWTEEKWEKLPEAPEVGVYSESDQGVVAESDTMKRPPVSQNGPALPVHMKILATLLRQGVDEEEAMQMALEVYALER